MKPARIQLIIDLLREFEEGYRYSEPLEPLTFEFLEEESLYMIRTWFGLSQGIEVKARSVNEAIIKFEQELEYRLATLDFNKFKTFFKKAQNEGQ